MLFCCSCIGNEPIKASIKKSHSIFIGTIVDSTLIEIEEKLEGTNSNISHYFVKYSVAIKSLFKGKVYSDTISLYSGIGGGDCGYPFNLGSDYIIYADYKKTLPFQNNKPNKRFFYTDICKRTCKVNENELKKISIYKKSKENK